MELMALREARDRALSLLENNSDPEVRRAYNLLARTRYVTKQSSPQVLEMLRDMDKDDAEDAGED